MFCSGMGCWKKKKSYEQVSRDYLCLRSIDKLILHMRKYVYYQLKVMG